MQTTGFLQMFLFSSCFHDLATKSRFKFHFEFKWENKMVLQNCTLLCHFFLLRLFLISIPFQAFLTIDGGQNITHFFYSKTKGKEMAV